MLTPISHQLIDHYLGKADINSYLKNTFIRELYNSLSKNNYRNSKVRHYVEERSFPTSDFMANSIMDKIEMNDEVMTFVWTTTGKFPVRNTLHIYMKDIDDLPNTELLIRAISFITAFSNKRRKITIHLCLLSDKKMMRKNQQRLTNLNVNSGSNRFSETSSEICIFRREECLKVIFHEVLHGLRCSSLDHHSEITERLCLRYKLKSKDILIDESYTETWAKIMNCFFISSLTTSSNKFQHFCTLLASEKEFSIYQANKIQQFVKNSKDKNLDRETNVSAYYLVVGEIFSNLEQFLTMCNKNPYLKNHLECFEYLYSLQKFPKKQVNVSDPFYSTLRMSVSELKV